LRRMINQTPRPGKLVQDSIWCKKAPSHIIGPLAALFDGGFAPSLRGYRENQVVHPNRMVGCNAKAQADRSVTAPFPLGQINFKTRFLDQGRILDFREPPLFQFRYPVQKSVRFTLQFIGSHPLKRQTVALNGPFSQIQPDFRFRFGFQIGGNTIHPINGVTGWWRAIT
jgi:hypothetical protein